MPWQPWNQATLLINTTYKVQMWWHISGLYTYTEGNGNTLEKNLIQKSKFQSNEESNQNVTQNCNSKMLSQCQSGQQRSSCDGFSSLKWIQLKISSQGTCVRPPSSACGLQWMALVWNMSASALVFVFLVCFYWQTVRMIFPSSLPFHHAPVGILTVEDLFRLLKDQWTCFYMPWLKKTVRNESWQLVTRPTDFNSAHWKGLTIIQIHKPDFIWHLTFLSLKCLTEWWYCSSCG